MRRREWRRARRMRERAREETIGRVIVTWNLQRVSMREANRVRLRRVCERVIKEKWEIVLVSELLAESNGVVWLGENENECVIIHSKKAGVILRGEALNVWVNEGQQKWYSERVTTVVLGGMRLMAVYQPSIGMDEMAMEVMREEVERQIRLSKNERVIIGGDFNANVGKNEERPGVCGKYGLGILNEARRNLIEWCEENDLAYVNSYMRHARRGT